MESKKIIAALFLGIVFVVTGAPVTMMHSTLELKTASAVRPSGQEYLAQVNAQRQAMQSPQRPLTGGAAQNLVNYINNNVTDAGYAALAAKNQELVAAGGAMLATPAEIGRVLEEARIDPNTQMPDPTAPPLTQDTPSGPTDCDAGAFNMAAFFNPTCWGRMLGAFVASLFVSIGVKVLELAGLLFNKLVLLTIVSFKTDIYRHIEAAVTAGWTVFRDIANILIIGIFTFIALSIILGLKEYGQKKLIAQVLIVAVLINFSLLFTKMVIDASNFTALQFYYAAVAPNEAVASTQTTVTGVAKDSTATVSARSSGISGQFMQAIGITGFSDSYIAVRKVQEESDNGFVGFFFGVLSLIYLLGAAIVLFYGSFLLISRAILLVFLMITSSLAFASRLVPAWESSSYGWQTWKDSLIKCAAFAPILMLFLWITLQIAKGLKVITTGTTLGRAAEAPQDNVTAIFGYLMILGMLFFSFKLSSVFAGKITGFSVAGAAAIAPLALSSRFLAAPLMRGLAGGASYGIRGRLTESAQKATSAQAKAQMNANLHVRAGNKELAAQAQQDVGKFKKIAESRAQWASRFGGVADKKFNVMDTGVGKAIAKQVGLSGFAAGASAKADKSYAGRIKAQAEAAEKKTPGITETQRTEVHEEAKGIAREQRRAARESLNTTKESAKTTKESIEKVVEQQKQTLEQQRTIAANTLQGHEAAAKETSDRYQETIAGIELDKVAGKPAAEVAVELDLAKEKRGIELGSEALKINEARKAVEEIETKMTNLRKVTEFDDGTTVEKSLEDAAEALNKVSRELAEHDTNNDAEVERLATNIEKGLLETARQNVGGGIGRREAGIIAQFTFSGERVAKETRSRLKTSAGTASIKKALEDYVKESGGGTPSEPTPPTP